MACWHDQWGDAYAEVAALADGPLKDMLKGWLSEARELIREENTPTDRRNGGILIRDARLMVAELPFGCRSEDVDESAGMREETNGESWQQRIKREAAKGNLFLARVVCDDEVTNG